MICEKRRPPVTDIADNAEAATPKPLPGMETTA